jgi:hypothetical protein
MTTPTSGQRCQWVFVQSSHNRIRGVTGTALLRSAASLTLPTTGRQCHCGIMLNLGRTRHRNFWSVDPDPVKAGLDLPPLAGSVIDTFHQSSAVSLTPPTQKNISKSNIFPNSNLQYIRNDSNPAIRGSD